MDDMLNITNDYRKHVMNKFCHTALLPDRMCAFAGGRESGKYKLGAGCTPTAADEVYVVYVRTLLEAN